MCLAENFSEKLFIIFCVVGLIIVFVRITMSPFAFDSLSMIDASTSDQLIDWLVLVGFLVD